MTTWLLIKTTSYERDIGEGEGINKEEIICMQLPYKVKASNVKDAKSEKKT